MRIDPSKLSEPLAHILNAGATDATRGQAAAAATTRAPDAANVDRLDQMLLQRLRANMATDAADSVLTFQDAQVRIQQLQDAMARDLSQMRGAHGSLESGRVRGLLDG